MQRLLFASFLDFIIQKFTAVLCFDLAGESSDNEAPKETKETSKNTVLMLLFAYNLRSFM